MRHIELNCIKNTISRKTVYSYKENFIGVCIIMRRVFYFSMENFFELYLKK